MLFIVLGLANPKVLGRRGCSSSPVIVKDVVVVVLLMIKVWHVRCIWAPLQCAKSHRRYVVLTRVKWWSWMTVLSRHMRVRWLSMFVAFMSC